MVNNLNENLKDGDVKNVAVFVCNVKIDAIFFFTGLYLLTFPERRYIIFDETDKGSRYFIKNADNGLIASFFNFSASI